jgi:hypothetical protein
MALWSHLKTLCSDPGFIPRGYSYDKVLMTPTNVSLLNYIQLNHDKLNGFDTVSNSSAGLAQGNIEKAKTLVGAMWAAERHQS